MAHKKAGGSTSLGRDSISKRLGVKLYEGQQAKNGSILVRQRGSKFRAGANVMKGGDDTLFATAAGTVVFKKKKARRFDGSLKEARFVSVVPESANKKKAPAKSKAKKATKAKSKPETKTESASKATASAKK